jgi:putative nucleotidyltransferase with HDIG domain
MGTDVAGVIANLRARPSSGAVIALGAALTTGIVVLAGGPPTPWTHVFYFVLLAAAVLWGARWGVLIGLIGGVLVGPVAAAIVGHAQWGESSWVVRAVAMMLVGGAVGALASALLSEVEQLASVNHEMSLAFVRAIDARDPNTARHSELVAFYAAELANELGLDSRAVERIRQTALLHDVGKLGLERSVLQKPGILTPEEWQEVRDHPALSEHILRGVDRFQNCLPGVLYHHERYDGAGYPHGLAGEDIPLDARIIAVSDAFDAMTSDRAYRPGLSIDEAKAQLRDGSGTQFDPDCVRAFLRLDLNHVCTPPAIGPAELAWLAGPPRTADASPVPPAIPVDRCPIVVAE